MISYVFSTVRHQIMMIFERFIQAFIFIKATKTEASPQFSLTSKIALQQIICKAFIYILVAVALNIPSSYIFDAGKQ
jgi:hypothetical protein